MKLRFDYGIKAALLCLFMLASATYREGRVLGADICGGGVREAAALEAGDEALISTSELGAGVRGYAGPVPLAIYIRDGRISRVEALENSETPSFFAEVERSILGEWDGLTLEEALEKDVEAVSGATLSSNAATDTFRLGVKYALGLRSEAEKSTAAGFDARTICAVAVAASGTLLPLFVKSQKFRVVQLVLNTAVLGFWSGTFLSLSLLAGMAAGGVWVGAASLLLLPAFVMPLVGRRGHYCAWLCPMGSIQELAGRMCPAKVKIAPGLAKSLELARRAVWAVMMMLLWTGAGMKFAGCELFSAFLLRRAAAPVLLLAAAFILLSLITPRPYCRFLCPTGSLMKFIQNGPHRR